MRLVCFAIVVALGLQSPQVKPEMPVSDFLLARYNGGKTHLIKLAERMPETEYGFRPTPEMQPFAVRIAHVAAMNFEKCAFLVGKPNPHEGARLEATVTKKPALMKLLEESFAFCDAYMNRLSPKVMAETYAAKAPPGAQFPVVQVELGGLAIDVVAHNIEMYGYLSVYLRLKGLVPPTSGK